MRISITLLFCLFMATGFAQKPLKPGPGDIHQAIKKLNVLGSVLYVAAHPDDENQRFISYCANKKLFNVTYLSLTRGDGGQNLIGPELRELLGVLRTEELLMARSVDGGKQLFSRANDFGFSKSPDETLRFWNKDAVLADVVWAIRQTQPDVIVNRFYHDKKYDTHGHHTASAMLSVEAFDLAGRSDAFPEHLSLVKPWQARRQFFNTSWFFYGGRENFEKVDKSKLFSMDLGVFLPLKGKSNNEVAAEARSMHRCQGFGAMSSRGESLEYFDFIKGERPTDNDMFSGINTAWTRVPGGAPIGKLLEKVDKNFRADAPAASVPDLLKVLQMIRALPDGYWKKIKLAEIKEVIRWCLGLYLEASAAEPGATPGEEIVLRIEAINRSSQSVILSGLSILPGIFDTLPARMLENNKGLVFEKKVRLPANLPFSAPYWLLNPWDQGMYKVEDQALRGLAETPRRLAVRWSIAVNGIPLEYETPVAHKIEEAALGEVWRPFEVLPPVFVEFTESAYLATGSSFPVTVRVKAGRDKVRCRLGVGTPSGWPSAYSAANPPEIFLNKKGETAEYTFEVQCDYGPDEVDLSAYAQIDNIAYPFSLVPIKYDHIPQQSVLLPARAHAARLQVAVTSRNIGYYMGAGDEAPAALRKMGCTVTLLEDKDMTPEKLKTFDAVVLGIRAYNTREALTFHQAKLMQYVEAGGNLIVQYNNNFDLYLDKFTPFPMKLSRTRVTDEKAEVRILLPEHPALNTPNKITEKDFAGWVQERGLYFPGEWDPAFAAPLSMNDPGEKAANGALLIAPYGKGYYVYTGLSFFRELPAGVPGAYRLLANLISLGRK